MIENIIALPLIHIFSILGFGLALAFVIYLFKSNKSPSSTIAWLLVVFLIPYVGVPLYILFGGRKIRKMYEAKEMLWPHAKPVEDSGASMLPGRISVVFGIHEDPCLQAFMAGEEAFKELCSLIKEAKDHICISTFILGDDPTGRAVVDLLTEKLSEGVHV
ncbi:MAG: PLDc N-terminal domain-containing protein, partial [Candidatus Omnitrophica bacterium]|nr:PLDc N-terminal domain-containing protein [Candidatus Omnitrophota bacterium]